MHFVAHSARLKASETTQAFNRQTIAMSMLSRLTSAPFYLLRCCCTATSSLADSCPK
jgi:hypothetical protein